MAHVVSDSTRERERERETNPDKTHQSLNNLKDLNKV